MKRRGQGSDEEIREADEENTKGMMGRGEGAEENEGRRGQCEVVSACSVSDRG